MEAEQTRRELSELLDEDLHSREFQLYKDLVHRNMDHDKIEALLLSCKTDTPSPKWGHEPSTFTRPSSVPLPKQATYNPPVQGPGYGPSSFGNSRLPYRSALPSKNLPDRSTSKNQYINGKSVWGPGHGALCVKCGETGHVMKDHIGPNSYGPVLPAWEQSYLRNIVFGDMSAQSYFCTAGYGAYDGQTTPYGMSKMSSGSDGPTYDGSTGLSTYMSGGNGGVMRGESSANMSQTNVNSITYGIPDLVEKDSSIEAASANAFYGEGSGARKRQYMDASTLENPAVLPSNPPQFQAGGKTGKKGQKRVGKKAEPQPLVGMINESTRAYDKPVSIRQMLKQNKVDISWMDWLAWSPDACKEVKRLCTRVAKKRAPKVRTLGQDQSTMFDATIQPPLQGQTLPPVFPTSRTMLPTFQPSFQPTGPLQQFPQQVPPYVPASQQQPTPNKAPSGVAPPQHESGSSNAHSIQTDGQTRFLQALGNQDKAFRIECKIRNPAGVETHLGKATTQADQGSEMNVISQSLIKHLQLVTQPLASIGFQGLTMHTADQRDTPLKEWTEFWIGTAGIWRHVRCFVSPHTSLPGSAKSGHFNLLLGLPWLFSVNAHISIRESRISIGDPSLGESMRDIVGPEMVFCNEHTLIMYPKTVFTEAGEEDTSSDEDSSGDEVSEAEEGLGVSDLQ